MSHSVYHIAIVDDHTLFSSALAQTIESMPEFTVVLKAENGLDLETKLIINPVKIDLLLLDINMPVKNGFETASWLKTQHPDIHVMALSMDEEEQSILRMIKHGAKGYLLKDSKPELLKFAMTQILEKGHYYSEMVTQALLSKPEVNLPLPAKLTKRELEVLELCCTELSYAEIASQLNLSVKTIDGYRHILFQKLNVKTRIGLVLFAIKHRIITI